MPLICIGPVCVPISALLPILAYLARPVWRRLPPPTQQAILAYWKAFAEWTQANVWDRIGWKAAPKRSAPPPSGAAGGAAELAEGLRAKRGGVVAMLSEDDWDAAMALSAEACATGRPGGTCARGGRISGGPSRRCRSWSTSPPRGAARAR